MDLYQPLCCALAVSLWQHSFSLGLEAAARCLKAAKKGGCSGCFGSAASAAPCVRSSLASAARFLQVFGCSLRLLGCEHPCLEHQW